MDTVCTLTAADVIEAYTVLLNRTPESDAVIDMHLNAHTDRKSLFHSFVTSAEFARGLGKASTAHALFEAFDRPPNRVDHDVDAPVLQTMFDRIRTQWAKLGEQEPYFSVLSLDAYRSENLDQQSIETFWKSGERHAAIVDDFALNTGRPGNRGTCLELGCGLGRVTRHLAARFDRVIGVDISPGNLRLCRHSTADLPNVETLQVAGIEDFHDLPEFDFLFSTMVLQHNPPPVQKAILRILFSKIRPGGAALFQIPTDMAGYGFLSAGYLDAPITDMEMHGLPRSVVLAEMRLAGLDIVDVAADPFISELGSYTFYGVRPG